ncbi:MAG: thioredoxin domain-containing protein [Tsuneonella sp.]
MKAIRLAAVIVAALFAMAAGAPNWNTVIRATDGGHLIGNPDAKVKLIEFVSYTCPHCAHFAQDGDGALQIAYIGPGKVSVEVRHVIRDPIDLTIAMLANCGPVAKFPRNHAAFMLSQKDWIPVAINASKAQQQRWYSGAEAARRRAIASDFGFYDIMARRGYERTEVDRCLADDAAAKRMAATSAADTAKWDIPGTPSFAINNVLLSGTHEWSLLKPQLDARL